MFKGFIKGETIRYLRNTNDRDILSNMLVKFKGYLTNRDYDEQEIDESITDALDNNERTAALYKASKTKIGKTPLVLVLHITHA